MPTPRPARWLGVVLVVAGLVVPAAACGDDGGPDGGRPGGDGRSGPVESADLVDFIQIGHLEHTDEVRDAADGVELGSDEAASLATHLVENWPPQAGVPPPEQEEVGRALREAPPDGALGFGFLVSGCAETGAVLEAGDGSLHARLTGGEGVDCEAPVYFVVTFHVVADDIPENTSLTPRD